MELTVIPPRHRGRKQPKNIDHLRALAQERNAHRLRALPNVTDSSWDSRTKGWVGPVKDQAQCGSCWDFSGVGICEIAHNKAASPGGPQYVFAEEYVLSCLQNGGCNGDDNTTVLAAAKANGLPLAFDYGPYTAGGGHPSVCSYKPGMQLYKITDWGFADGGQGSGVTATQAIKNCIAAYGAVGCAIAADNAFEQWGNGGASFDRPFLGSSSRNIDHDVIYIGWKDDPSMAAGGYWILRNSWGPQWGVGGYMAIAYGANLGGTEAVFAVVDGTTPPPPPPNPQPQPQPSRLFHLNFARSIPRGGRVSFYAPVSIPAGGYDVVPALAEVIQQDEVTARP